MARNSGLRKRRRSQDCCTISANTRLRFKGARRCRHKGRSFNGRRPGNSESCTIEPGSGLGTNYRARDRRPSRGLPDSIGELDQRLNKAVEALDPVWRDEIVHDAIELTPSGFDWGNRETCAFRLAFLGRMLFSCLVDADFRDTEKYYCKAEGRIADRDWPELPRVANELIARFDSYMQAKKSDRPDTPVN
jgi:hypothetical protein